MSRKVKLEAAVEMAELALEIGTLADKVAAARQLRAETKKLKRGALAQNQLLAARVLSVSTKLFQETV